MIEASCIIQTLDIEEERSCEESVSEFFKRWAHLAKTALGPIPTKSISFKNHNIKIIDWTGWTQLTGIERFLYTGKFIQISCPSEDKYVIIPEDADVPVFEYNSKDSMKIIKAGDMKDGMKMFIRRIDQKDSPYRVNAAPIHIFPVWHSAVVYRLYTKSGFFNTNDFYMKS